MAKVEFPEGFVTQVKKVLPDKFALHKAIEEGDSLTVGSLLKAETLVPADFFTKVISLLENERCIRAITVLKHQREVIKLYDRWDHQWGTAPSSPFGT